MILNLLSGIITIRNRKLPLTWSGEKAEHLATDHSDYKDIHPFLHMKAQQFAKAGRLDHQGGKRYLSYKNIGGNDWVLVPLQVEGKFVLILSCILEKNQTFDTLKKQKRIGSTKGKAKITTKPPSEFQLSNGAVNALNAVGFDTEKARQSFWLAVNKIKPKK